VNDEPRVADLLAQARAAGVDRLDAQLLLARLLARPRTWLLAHDDAALDPTQLSAWSSLLTRRSAGEPLAYLLGEKEFRGLLLRVNANVLVPRPETEILVDWAIELLNGALSSILCVGGGTYAVISGSAADDLWMHLVCLPLSPALGALGGYLRSRQAARIA